MDKFDIEMFENLVKTRQSCRSFDGREVEKEKIDKILEIACLAPSACNSQPWSFVVVSGEKATELFAFLQPFGINKFVQDCRTFVVVQQEKVNLAARLGERFLGQDFAPNDVGIAIAHLVLASTALGVDSCILGAVREEKLKAFLSSDKKTGIVIALGYATKDYEIRKKTRKPEEKVKFL